MKKSIAVIIGLSVLFFWQTVFFGRIPFPGNFQLAWFEPWKSDHMIGDTITIVHKPVMDDVFRLLYPMRVLSVDLIKQFLLPLWNPYNGSGAPLLATYHEAYLNPFGIFFLIVQPPIAWTLFIILQLVFLGCATFWYTRSIRLSHQASLFTSIVLMFSGYVVVRLEYAQFLYGYAVLPILLTIIESWKQDQHTRLTLLIPPAILFLFLSGQPHMIVYVLIVSLLYCFFRCRLHKTIRYCGFVILGIGLASIQLFPSFELFTHSTIRVADTSRFIIGRFLVPVSHLVTILIPNYFGNMATYNYSGAGGDSIETMASIGLIPCLFAVFAIRKKNWASRFFGVMVMVTIALAIDWPGSRLFYQLPIPVVTSEAPSRIFALTTFAIAILSGIGLDYWLKRFSLKDIKKPILWYIGLIVAIAGVTAYVFMRKFPCPSVQVPACRGVSLRNLMLEIAPFFLVVSTLLIRKKLALITIFGAVIMLGFYNSYKFLPFNEPRAILPTNDVIQALQTQAKDGRFMGFGSAAMAADFSTAYRLYDANYYNPLHISRYAELVEYASSGNVDKLLRSDVIINPVVDVAGEELQRRNRLLQLLNVRYMLFKKDELKDVPSDIVWEDERWILVRNKHALPRVYTVNSILTVSNDTLLTTLFDPAFNPEKQVILEKNISTTLSADTVASVTLNSYKEQEVVMNVVSNGTTVLVVTDTYYPGWEAIIDGLPTPIYRANYALRSVIVPEGNHTIVMRYQPFSVRLGILTSLGFLLFYLFYVRFVWTKQSKTVSK